MLVTLLGVEGLMRKKIVSLMLWRVWIAEAKFVVLRQSCLFVRSD